jgi:hypothetical protein
MTDCNICLETKNNLIQLCPTCKCYCDKECMDKYISKNSFKCMICKMKPQRLKYFFAGKISLKKETEEYAPDDYFEYDKPNDKTRIFVLEKGNWTDKNLIENFESEKCAQWELDKEQEFTDLKDFLNLEEKLPNIKMKDYIITGPTCIMNTDELTSICHGSWQSNPLLDTSNMIKILNIRNYEMISSCNIFSLEVDENFSCYRSITEWGIAKEKGKILLINFESKDKSKCAEFYTHIHECLDSINSLDERMKELIIYCHPILCEQFSGFKQYKEYLEDIVKHKRSD